MSHTTDLASLDEQIAEAQHDIDAAQNHWRSRPRRMVDPGQFRVHIDPQARVDTLDRGLAVDEAVIRLETLKAQRAEMILAHLEDRRAMATEDAAIEETYRAKVAAEATAREAHNAWNEARDAKKGRAERIKIQRDELARAQAAIRGAEKVREREQTERQALMTSAA